MADHTFRPQRFHRTLGTHEPVLRLASGDTVSTTTVDARGYDASGTQVCDPGNPQTGPFAVRDAREGDTLAVRLDTLRPSRPRGWTRRSIAPNVLDPDYVAAGWHSGDTLEWRVDVEKGVAAPLEPPRGLEKLTLALSPMVGCFGVAAPGGQAISTATSGQHGGNMDYRGFVEGVTVYFPVFADEALFFIGDGHAVQGDGEIVGTGIEISFEVTFTVRVIKGRRIGWPRGEGEHHIFTVGNARPMDQATQHATTEMVRWLDEAGLPPEAAHLLLGQCVEYQVGNVFDPAYTMVCLLRKDLLRDLVAEAWRM